jgi:hypothetical protein
MTETRGLDSEGQFVLILNRYWMVIGFFFFFFFEFLKFQGTVSAFYCTLQLERTYPGHKAVL